MIINHEKHANVSIMRRKLRQAACVLTRDGSSGIKPVYVKVVFTRSRIAPAVSAGCASGSQCPALNSRNS